LKLFVLVLFVVAFGGLNKVGGKAVTVPMNEYSFFLAIFNAIVYVLLYYAILLARTGLGIVPKEQLKDVWRKHMYPPDLNCISKIGPWKYFLLTGLLDGLGIILQLIASPYLAGPIIALLSQSNILFSMIISSLILAKKYTFWEIWSVLVLYFGVTITLIPQFSGLEKPSLYYSLIMGFVALPQAISVTVKELLFRSHDFDLFVVNSHGSLFQLITFPIYLPLAIIFNQTRGQPLNEYIVNGFNCFVGKTPPGSKFDCSPDPYPYIIYIGINLVYNLLLLLLVKRASAVLSFMTIQAVLPVSVILFYIPWPLLVAEVYSTWTIVGLVIIIGALGLYQFFFGGKEED